MFSYEHIFNKHGHIPEWKSWSSVIITYNFRVIDLKTF